MSIYKKISAIGTLFFEKATLFKYGFNWSPMYRRSTAKIISCSDDLSEITIKLALSYKNKNYVNSIFGGSMFAAVDPIPMVQLINILDESYIVWDKSATIAFKRPAKEDLYATFTVTNSEVASIKQQIALNNEIEFEKRTLLTNKNKTTVFCEVNKTIYIASKAFYKEKRRNKKKQLDNK